MSSSVHAYNTKKDILVLGKGSTHRLEDKLTSGKMYSIIFTVTKRKLAL